MIKELLHSDGTVTTIPLHMEYDQTAEANVADRTDHVARCTRIEPDQISDVIGAPGKNDLLWLDIEQPTDEDIKLLREEFGFHTLAIEDIRHRSQRPKVDDYGSFVHVVIYAVERTVDGEIALHELDLFYGEHYLIAVHHDPIPALAEAISRWQQNTEILHYGVGALVYAVLDTLVDGYFPLLDSIEDAIEEAEELIFTPRRSGGFRVAITQNLFTLRRELLVLRRVIAPARDVMSTLARRALANDHADTAPYLQDVYDHVVRTLDTIDTYRDILSGAMDASLSVTSNRLNEVMKTMTAGSIILMADALIAGIYGMNFKDIPELSWRYGYAYALLLMVAVTALLAYLFRRAWWL